MANPLARVMMDQMSKKNKSIKTNTCSDTPERERNLDAREEEMISGLIHGSRGNLEVANGKSSSDARGKKVKLEDLVKKSSEKAEEPQEKPSKPEKHSRAKEKTSPVKDPYNKGGVKTSVIAKPGKDVVPVGLKSLGKGNLL